MGISNIYVAQPPVEETNDLSELMKIQQKMMELMNRMVTQLPGENPGMPVGRGKTPGEEIDRQIEAINRGYRDISRTIYQIRNETGPLIPLSRASRLRGSIRVTGKDKESGSYNLCSQEITLPELCKGCAPRPLCKWYHKGLEIHEGTHLADAPGNPLIKNYFYDSSFVPSDLQSRQSRPSMRILMKWLSRQEKAAPIRAGIRSPEQGKDAESSKSSTS
jgi:hypothetical protein